MAYRNPISRQLYSCLLSTQASKLSQIPIPALNKGNALENPVALHITPELVKDGTHGSELVKDLGGETQVSCNSFLQWQPQDNDNKGYFQCRKKCVVLGMFNVGIKKSNNIYKPIIIIIHSFSFEIKPWGKNHRHFINKNLRKQLKIEGYIFA